MTTQHPSPSGSSPRSGGARIAGAVVCVVGLLLVAAALVSVASEVGVLPSDWVVSAARVVSLAVPLVLGLVCGGLAVGGYRLTRTVVTFRHRRDVLNPLHVVLAQVLMLPEGWSPSRYLWVSTRRHRDEQLVRVGLPRTFTGDPGTKAAVERAVLAKLGLSDVSWNWQLRGRCPCLVVKSAPRPPAKVLYGNLTVREQVRKAKESAPMIGQGLRLRIVSVDLDAESPHVLVSAGTGGGKSSIVRTLVAQFLSRGALADILDVKRISHSKWTRGLSAVRYHRDIAEIHDGLVMLAAEGERRNRLADEWDAEGHEGDPDVGPRRVVVVEEANVTIARLKRYWNEVREKGDPKESPAITALGDLLFMGRQVRMNVILVAQYATAIALGGPEIREQFATRILARYTQNAWRMLIPEIPFTASTRHAGRAQVALGGVAHECQVLFLTEAEAADLASLGVVREQVASQRPSASAAAYLRGAAPETPRTVPDEPPARPGDGWADGQPWSLYVRPVEESRPPLVSLRDATTTGVLTCSLDAVRKAAQRDDGFPPIAGSKGTTNLYDPHKLREWEAARNAKKAE